MTLTYRRCTCQHRRYSHHMVGDAATATRLGPCYECECLGYVEGEPEVSDKGGKAVQLERIWNPPTSEELEAWTSDPVVFGEVDVPGQHAEKSHEHRPSVTAVVVDLGWDDTTAVGVPGEAYEPSDREMLADDGPPSHVQVTDQGLFAPAPKIPEQAALPEFFVFDQNGFFEMMGQYLPKEGDCAPVAETIIKEAMALHQKLAIVNCLNCGTRLIAHSDVEMASCLGG